MFVVLWFGYQSTGLLIGSHTPEEVLMIFGINYNSASFIPPGSFVFLKVLFSVSRLLNGTSAEFNLLNCCSVTASVKFLFWRHIFSFLFSSIHGSFLNSSSSSSKAFILKHLEENRIEPKRIPKQSWSEWLKCDKVFESRVAGNTLRAVMQIMTCFWTSSKRFEYNCQRWNIKLMPNFIMTQVENGVESE